MFKKIIFITMLLSSMAMASQSVVDGKVMSRDLLTNDTKSAITFYTKLFGWTAEKKKNFTKLTKNGRLMANVVEIKPEKHSLWVPQFTHHNLVDAKKTVLDNGGLIVKDVHTKENFGDFIVIRDQEHALCVISKANGFKQPSGFVEVNEWLWDELWSHDIKASSSFYQKLFSYEEEKTPSGYIVFKKADEWLSGLLVNPYKKSQTQWASTVRVSNPKETAEKAKALGGKILVNIEKSETHAPAVILTDPTGALFIIEKYEEKAPR